jgi:heterokaryon incompatibility protein (HET)
MNHFVIPLCLTPGVLHLTVLRQIGPMRSVTRTVYLNGCKFEVRRNLEAALRRLRYDRINPYWIDALCIDQSNMQEKIQQIEIMGQSYQDAVTTVVWLGPEADESSYAWEGIQVLSSNWSYKNITSWHGIVKLEDSVEYQEQAQYDLEYDIALRNIRAISELLNRSWFHRAWILQEVALPKAKVYVIWGEEAILYWNDIEDAVLSLRQHYKSFGLFINIQNDKVALFKAPIYGL